MSVASGRGSGCASIHARAARLPALISFSRQLVGDVMASHSDPRLDRIQRKVLSVGGESLRKKLSDPEMAGRVVARAIELSGLTQQDLAFRLGYANQSHVSQWISGVENPPLAKLMSRDLPTRWRQALVIAMAEQLRVCGVEVKTVVTLSSEVAS